MVDLVALDHLAVAEDAVFAVQGDVATFDVVRHQGRDAGSEVDVAAFGQQRRGPSRHLVARPADFAVVFARLVGGAPWSQPALVRLDGLLHDPRHQDPG